MRNGNRLALAVIASALACGADEGSSAPVQGLIDSDTLAPAPDTAPGDTPSAAADLGAPEDVPPVGPNRLSYSFTPAGGSACVDSCAVTMDAGDSVDLSVRLVDGNGAGVADTAIQWSTEAAGLKLGAATSYTGADGVATATITGLSAESNAIVRAQVLGDSSIADLPFSVTVEAAGPPALEVTVAYAGTQGVTAFELRVFDVTGKALGCAEIHPDAGNSHQPSSAVPGVAAGKATPVQNLPGLNPGGKGSYLLQALGPAGVPKAEGCRKVEVTHGQTETVTVDVSDLPLRFLGVTDITTNMDLYTGLPGQAGSAVGLIIGLFDSPGGTVIDAACANPSGALGTLCPILKGSDSIKQAADEAFYGLIKQFVDEDILFAGDAIASLFETLRLKSTLEVTSEAVAQEGGLVLFPENALVETWLYMQYAWKFGKSCDPLDDDCGWEVVKLADVFGASPVAAPSGGVEGGSGLTIDVHEVPGFNYGALFSFMLEKKLLPSLFGDGIETIDDPDGYCDGMVSDKADNYEDVIGMIFGDECCTLFDDCCEFFVQKPAVYDYTGGNAFLEGIAATACELLITEGGQFIRGQLSSLGGDLVLGTTAACPAVDLDGDREIDGLGTAAAPCSWDATIDFSGVPFQPKNTWTGKHK